MNKPTLFLSHAARDAELLARLKQLLLNATGGTIEIFVSSDGQSIPFGRNWVHDIEQALQRAKLMFLFLSPAALQSRWIPFEAGHAYAREIRVVPVGIFGVDLVQIGPPLSLLQGFNLVSAGAMNNLLAVINRTFDFQFPEKFTTADFEQAFACGPVHVKSLFEPHTDLARNLIFQAMCEHDPQSNAVRDFLESKGLEPFGGDRERILYTPGLSLDLHKGSIRLRVDPLLSAPVFSFLGDFLEFLSPQNVTDGVKFEFELLPPARAVDQIHELSARIFGTELRLGHNRTVIIEDLSLNLYQDRRTISVSSASVGLTRRYIENSEPNGVKISCHYAGKNLASVPISEALTILFRVGALWLDESR